MPKEITHWILAERVLNQLGENNPLSGIIRANHSIYLAGTVLPDTLLHLFRGPHSRIALRLAHRFHDATDNSYGPLIRAEARYPDGLPPSLLACLLGVISHILTDSVFHPYVYARSGIHDIGLHYRLETAMDVHFLHCGVTSPARRMDELTTPETRQMLRDAMALLFDPDGELPQAALEQSLALHCRIQGMYDRTWWKIAAMLLGTLLGSPFREQRQLFYPLDASGSNHRMMIDSIGSWKHPVSGAVMTNSIDDLADEAVQQTVAIFRRIEERGSLAMALEEPPGANLLTGLVGIGMAEMGHGRQEREVK
ncbi:MAG: zinc dependent phospholipase C family protein [Desulfuromonadales bacterium]|nr:zinc dependent phospholipase C family protein [Desulfuromonadales bacterium]